MSITNSTCILHDRDPGVEMQILLYSMRCLCPSMPAPVSPLSIELLCNKGTQR